MAYHNPHQGDDRRSLYDFILWKVGYYDDNRTSPAIPKGFTYPLPPTDEELQATARWINHSTFLIEVGGVRFLTDPIWSHRCSPFSCIGPIRKHPPACRLEELPVIDYVLISHDHYDHLDKPTVQRLAQLFPKIIWLVPKGVKKWLVKWGITQVFECDWWEKKEFPGVCATCVPAQHFSGRRGFDSNWTLWGGWVVETGGKRFYFVGDTGYNAHDFKKIGEKWDFMDLSLIPIGSYSPRAFMSPVHIEPVHAVTIHQEVHSKKSIAMHWNTFHLSDEPRKQPPYDLFLALQAVGIDPHTFLAVDPGYVVHW